MRVMVDREKCEGAAVCVAVAPTVFEMDDENKAVVVDATAEDDATLMRAAKGCPYKAVILEDDQGKQLYP